MVIPLIFLNVPQSSQAESLGLASHLLPLNTTPLQNPTILKIQRILRNSLAAKAIVTAPTAEEVEDPFCWPKIDANGADLGRGFKDFLFSARNIGEMIHLD